jgi:hypothetical protein
LTYIGFKIELELASDTDSSVAVGVAPLPNVDLVRVGFRVGWSAVCPLTELDKQKVVEAASIAAKKGDKRIALRSFGTSTHHVYFMSANDALGVSLRYQTVLCCPLSIVYGEFKRFTHRDSIILVS